MSEPLIVKTFSSLPNIQYLETFNRPARGHTILGILLLLVLIWILYKTKIEMRPYLLVASVILLLIVAIISATLVNNLNTGIREAAGKNILVYETERSYDGNKGFFPLSPFVGALAGIVIGMFLTKFATIDLRTTIVTLVLSLGVGVLLGVGLMYLYLEKKIDRQILVQKYVVGQNK